MLANRGYRFFYENVFYGHNAQFDAMVKGLNAFMNSEESKLSFILKTDYRNITEHNPAFFNSALHTYYVLADIYQRHLVKLGKELIKDYDIAITNAQAALIVQAKTLGTGNVSTKTHEDLIVKRASIVSIIGDPSTKTIGSAQRTLEQIKADLQTIKTKVSYAITYQRSVSQTRLKTQAVRTKLLSSEADTFVQGPPAEFEPPLATQQKRSETSQTGQKPTESSTIQTTSQVKTTTVFSKGLNQTPKR